MSIKRRLEKLEEILRIKDNKVYVVFNDFSSNIARIPAINFKGTIEEGSKILETIENKKMVVEFNIPRPIESQLYPE